MRYYIVNGIEIGFFLIPAYIDDRATRVCYMGLMYYFLNSDAPFFYTELKKRLLKN